MVAAAGDIACDPDSAYFNRGFGRGEYCRQRDTSRLLSGAAAVLALGDTQYEHSSLSNIRASYDRSWGKYKSRTRPAIGNHEYAAGLRCSPTRCPTNRGAAGYFDYFGARAGPRGRAYHSYNVGKWHVVVLNSMCWAAGGCGKGSPQERWLRSDLAKNGSKKCVLAYWHHPPFSSGQSRGYTYYRAFWRALHEARADIVLAGHDHVYERFARQSATGSASSTGPVQFMVGTGGKNLGKFVTRQAEQPPASPRARGAPPSPVLEELPVALRPGRRQRRSRRRLGALRLTRTQ